MFTMESEGITHCTLHFVVIAVCQEPRTFLFSLLSSLLSLPISFLTIRLLSSSSPIAVDVSRRISSSLSLGPILFALFLILCISSAVPHRRVAYFFLFSVFLALLLDLWFFSPWTLFLLLSRFDIRTRFALFGLCLPDAFGFAWRALFAAKKWSYKAKKPALDGFKDRWQAMQTGSGFLPSVSLSG